jgi:peptide/nickel transport system substrate-binding protein
MRLSLLCTALLLLAACRSHDVSYASGDDGGTMIVSSAGAPNAPIPMLAVTVSDIEVGSTMFERLAEPGPDLNTAGDEGFTPVLADRWTWAPDSLSIAFHVNPRARWHDGVPVTAKDVRFTFEAYRDPTTGSTVTPLIANIDSVTVRDSLTAVFWYHRRYPEQFFDASYQMFILPAHLLAGMKHSDIRTSDFARHPVGSGPFRFSRWVPSSLFEVVADTTHYRGRPHLDRIIWSVAPDYVSSVTRLFSGEADFIEYLRPEGIPELAKHPELRLLRWPSLNVQYLVFNLRDPKHPARPHPIFGSRAVRRALTMGVNREALVRSVLDSLGSVALGPFTRAQATSDTTIAQLPFDTTRAMQLLDSLGWRDRDGDGIRDRNGVPLRFTLIAPTSSSVRVRASVLLQQMFAKIGAQVELQQLEFNLFQQRLHEGTFDAAINSINMDPSPGSIRQTWGTQAARARGGDNVGSYENATFDAEVDSAITAMDPEQSKVLYRRAYSTIVADAPAIWLYEVVNTAAISKRIHPANLRPDGWWVDLGAWSIPAGERIARDRIGLAEATR